MRCAKCGHIGNDNHICNHCGADMIVFLRTKNISIRLYNRGLELTRESDLSGAIPVLEQSLSYDKKNIHARNLLGLVYCEMGRMADALKHWIISTSFQKKDNLANEYMTTLQQNARKMERWNDSVAMYNNALDYLKTNNEDLAIIQLKKALDINPNFIDASNLMTLCCLEENNHQRATQFINSVLERDCRNPFALHYQKYIADSSPYKGMRKVERVQTNNRSAELNHLNPDKKTDNTSHLSNYNQHKKNTSFIEKRTVFTFLCGFGIATLSILALWFPSVIETKDNEIQELTDSLLAYTGSTNMTPEEVLGLRAELEKLESENRSLRSEETKQANLEILHNSVSLFADKNYVECVNLLFTIDTLGFSDTDLDIYNSLKLTAYPEASSILYNQGKGEYLSNRFAEAKINLEKSLNFVTNEDFIDDAYFYLGKIAEQNANIEEAKTYYNKIISEFPNSNQIMNVENSLQQLSNN